MAMHCAFATQSTDEGESWFEYAAVQLLAGDVQGYRRACSFMLEQSLTNRRIRPYHAARACTLASGIDEKANLLRAATLAADELQNHAGEFWSLTERGALAHRTGRSHEAVPLLERSLQAENKPGVAVLNWLWLALVHRQLGQLDQANRWLSTAEKWLDRQGDSMPSDAKDKGLHLHNWLEAHVLHRQTGESRTGSVGRSPDQRGEADRDDETLVMARRKTRLGADAAARHACRRGCDGGPDCPGKGTIEAAPIPGTG